SAPASSMAAARGLLYAAGSATPLGPAFRDQGLGMYWSYVWMEAARSFETALEHDPDCAYAWLMLSRSVEKWGKAGGSVTANPFAAAVGALVHAKLPDRVGESVGDFALASAP